MVATGCGAMHRIDEQLFEDIAVVSGHLHFRAFAQQALL